MIVAKSEIDSVVERLMGEEFLSLDTETTGLMLWKEDYLFSIIIGSSIGAFYFNFWDKPAHDESTPPEEFILPKEYTLKKLEALLRGKYLFLHNAKFDMRALAKEGLLLDGEIHDTEVGARLERNDLISYELGECAKRIGREKSEAVEEYISKHKLWEWKSVPGKKSRKKNKFFHLVPFGIISEYGLRDAEVTYALGIHQIEAIKIFDERHSEKKQKLSAAFEMERKTTPVAFSIENIGMLINLPYCDEAIVYEDARAHKVTEEFKKVTGFDFVDSGKHLAQVFSAMGFDVPQTEKGNPSFTDEILGELKNPVAELVREYRDAAKRANTYFRSFKFFSDSKGILHTNLRQAGTATGRFSSSDPNLQNLSKDEDLSLKYPVRRAFIPRPGFMFVMIDYDQMEFRMMLDYAGQLDLIEEIVKGLDPHQATADLVGIPRRPAKTLNFALLYGMGNEKLANTLDIELYEAKRFKFKYFSNLPMVKMFLNKTSLKAEKIGFVRDWLGRVFYFGDPKFSYKAANAIIQGGCSSVMKIALCRLHDFLKDKKSNLIMTVHDEALFEVHESEFYIIEKLQEIMENVYPHKHIKLTCSVSHSLESWGDPVEGYPEDAEGNEIQDQSSRSFKEAIGERASAVVH